MRGAKLCAVNRTINTHVVVVARCETVKDQMLVVTHILLLLISTRALREADFVQVLLYKIVSL
jgi:hypothetical protein